MAREHPTGAPGGNRGGPEPATEERAAVQRSAGFPVVGVGASAGSLEPLGALLGSLGDAPGLAVVVVPHLDPKHSSHLAPLLGRRTPLPVREITDGMAVERDHVYVLPPNASVTLQDGTLVLQERDAGQGSPHPIDRFFRSLAEDRGVGSVGVVLSGTLNDGTEGLRQIQGAGGFTFVQDPETAGFRGMPDSAIALGRIDFVLPPEQMGLEIARLPLAAYVQAKPDDGLSDKAALVQLFRTLRSQTGIDFSEYKPTTVLRRVHRRMTALRSPDLDAYAKRAQASPDEARKLRDELLINVTRFFREWDILEPLQDEVFETILRNRGDDDPVRIWVPGCATGEEAYSLAIALREFLVARQSNAAVQVFGTDVSEAAIEAARAGQYAESIIDDVAGDLLARYFDRNESGYRVTRQLRASCVFAVHDLGRDPPFSRMDLVSCRNVLIYMEPALQRRILSGLHYALKPSGHLILGSSEAIGRYEDMFAPVRKKQRVFRKVGTRTSGAYEPHTHVPRVGVDDGHARSPPGWTDADARRVAERVLLERFTPPAVVVNGNLDVVEFGRNTNPFLMHGPGPASLNLMRIAREGLPMELRGMIDEVQKAGRSVERRGVRVRTPEGVAVVDLEAIPLGGPDMDQDFVLVTFQPVSRQGDDQGVAENEQRGGPDETSADFEDMAHLQRELAAAREYLRSIVEDYEVTNEELRSANEEALSTNEELQSTNEELETAKEELQSTNEELTTLNEELLTRNEEVQKVNNDVLNLLNSVNIPIVMLGSDLRIRRFTAAARRDLNLIVGDVGRPFSDIALPFDRRRLAGAIDSVTETLQRQVLSLPDDNGGTWTIEVTPYRTEDDRIDGVVLVARRDGAESA